MIADCCRPRAVKTCKADKSDGHRNTTSLLQDKRDQVANRMTRGVADDARHSFFVNLGLQVDKSIKVLQKGSADDTVESDVLLARAYRAMLVRRAKEYAELSEPEQSTADVSHLVGQMSLQQDEESPMRTLHTGILSVSPLLTDDDDSQVSPMNTVSSGAITVSQVEDDSQDDILALMNFTFDSLSVGGRDEQGKYFLVNTNKGGDQFFYPDLTTGLKPLDGTWTFPMDFPKWCLSISEYCEYWEFDNIILGQPLTKTEEEALAIVMEKSLKLTFKLNINYDSKASDIFKQVQRLAMPYFTHAVKDKEWKKSLVDTTTDQIEQYIDRLDCLRFMEICTENLAEYRADDEYITSRMFETVEPELQRNAIHVYFENFQYQEYEFYKVRAIIDLVLRNNQKPSGERSKQCSKCRSTFHSAPNCMKLWHSL